MTGYHNVFSDVLHHHWQSVPCVLCISEYQDDLSDRCSVAVHYHTRRVNSRQFKTGSNVNLQLKRFVYWTAWFKLSPLKECTSSDFIFPGLSNSPHLHQGLHSHALPTAGPPCPPQTWFCPPSIPLFLSPISNTLIHKNNPLPSHPPPQHTKPLHCATHVLPICFSFVKSGGFSDPHPLFCIHTPPLKFTCTCVRNMRCTFWIFAHFYTVNLVPSVQCTNVYRVL